MTSLTGNPDVLFDAELLEAWRPSERLDPADRAERHVIPPPEIDDHCMLRDAALAEVTALSARWTKQILADARLAAREVGRRGLCRKGNETAFAEFLVSRCEAICKRMRDGMIEAVENATLLGHRRSQ